MPAAGKSKGAGQEDKVRGPDKHNTASKGMAELSKGAGGSGDPEAPDDIDYVRPAGGANVEQGRSHEERKQFGDRSDT